MFPLGQELNVLAVPLDILAKVRENEIVWVRNKETNLLEMSGKDPTQSRNISS